MTFVEDLVQLQDSHEGALRNFYRSDLTHPLLSLFLLLEQLSLTGNISTVTLSGHILTDSLNRLSGNDLGTDSYRTAGGE